MEQEVQASYLRCQQSWFGPRIQAQPWYPPEIDDGGVNQTKFGP